MGIENTLGKIFKKSKKPSTIEFELGDNGKLIPLYHDPSSDLNDPLPVMRQRLEDVSDEEELQRLKTVDQFVLEHPDAVILDLISNPDPTNSSAALAIKGVSSPHVIIENLENPIDMTLSQSTVGIIPDHLGLRMIPLAHDPISK